jgi:hypothetical protein
VLRMAPARARTARHVLAGSVVVSLLIWNATSCSRGPAQIAATAPGAPIDTKPQAVSPDDAGDAASWLTEAMRDDFPPVELEGADASAPDARSDAIATGGQLAAGDATSADASTPVAAINAMVPGKDFPVYCFSWVHLRDFSTDCFRKARECEQARRQKRMGHRMTTPSCEKELHAACTTVVADGNERCFWSVDNCVRYRDFLASRGMETTVCVYR